MIRQAPFPGLRWIVFEGIDGSGKTTQAKLLAAHLGALGIHSTYRHVFDTDIGRVVRRLFLGLDDLSNMMEILLLVAARERYIQTVAHLFLSEGGVLITDRFFSSIESMQGMRSASDFSLIGQLKKAISRDLKPDIVIFLDTPPEECQRRIRRTKGSQLDRIESQSLWFHERVRSSFLEVLHHENHKIVNGANTIDAVHNEVLHILKLGSGQRVIQNE